MVWGKAYDLCHSVDFTSFAQAEDLAERIDLRHLKLDIAGLGALNLCTGSEARRMLDPFRRLLYSTHLNGVAAIRKLRQEGHPVRDAINKMKFNQSDD